MLRLPILVWQVGFEKLDRQAVAHLGYFVNLDWLAVLILYPNAISKVNEVFDVRLPY
jgi:hypothetical protein